MGCPTCIGVSWLTVELGKITEFLIYNNQANIAPIIDASASLTFEKGKVGTENVLNHLR